MAFMEGIGETSDRWTKEQKKEYIEQKAKEENLARAAITGIQLSLLGEMSQPQPRTIQASY